MCSRAAFSVEIKTSSSGSKIFGNRSVGQKSDTGATSKKDSSGYFLAVNFQKFSTTGARAGITMVRFGWLDRSDWISQRASTGQQAHLAAEVYAGKFVQLYPSLDNSSDG